MKVEDGFKLDGKVAVVTGASRGIGKEIAMTYAEAGAKVVLVSRDQEALNSVAQEIQDNDGIALPVATHVGKSEDITNLVSKIENEFGGVDILVNNAGTNPHFGPILTADEGMWLKTLDTNLIAYFRMVKALVPLMLKRGGGSIINMSSSAGKRAQPGMGVYCVSKAGVLMLTEVLASELGNQKIRVNALAPGFIKTKFSKALWSNEAINNKIVKATPLNRIAETNEVAGIALYLASDASSFTTGSTFVIDGGLLASSGISL